MMLYNPYSKMYPIGRLRITDLDENKKTAIKEELAGLSPKKQLERSRVRTLEATRSRLAVDTAEQIELDKQQRQAALAQINQNRVEAVNQAISAEK